LASQGRANTQLQVRRGDRQPALLRLHQKIGKNRDGRLALDDTLRSSELIQQRRLCNAEFHGLAFLAYGSGCRHYHKNLSWGRKQHLAATLLRFFALLKSPPRTFFCGNVQCCGSLWVTALRAEIHNHKGAIREAVILDFLNANEPCCCDDFGEFVESVVSGAILKPYSGGLQVAICENLGKPCRAVSQLSRCSPILLSYSTMIPNFFTSFPQGADTRRRKKVAWKNSYAEIFRQLLSGRGNFTAARP